MKKLLAGILAAAQTAAAARPEAERGGRSRRVPFHRQRSQTQKTVASAFGSSYSVTGGDDPVNACELTASITAAANVLASRLTDEELSLLGSVLTQLADTLFTIAAYRDACGPSE